LTRNWNASCIFILSWISFSVSSLLRVLLLEVVVALEAVFFPYFYSTPHGAGYKLYIGHHQSSYTQNEARAKN
jgi:hypothetical protein